jgi:hypothetical protein
VARASDQVRSSDVTYWGMVALACCAFAVVSANVSALIPAGVFGGLHANRLDGGSLNQMRAEIARLEAAGAKLAGDNKDLAERLALTERAAGDVMRRVGAVEASLPDIIAKQNAIDSRSVTAATGQAPTLFGGAATQQAMPPPAAPKAWGIAIGRPVTPDGASAEWSRVTLRAGALLLGLAPLLASDAGGSGRVVAGPVGSETRALALCNELARSDIACTAVAYEGTALR